MHKLIAAAPVVLALAACGGSPPPQPVAPDYSPVPGQAVTTGGQMVVGCVRQAIQADRYDMIGDDGESRLIRFTCEGAEAQRLFDALAVRSAEIGSEWVDAGVTFRSTERIQQNLYGADMCSRDGAGYRCTFNLNLGGFIAH